MKGGGLIFGGWHLGGRRRGDEGPKCARATQPNASPIINIKTFGSGFRGSGFQTTLSDLSPPLKKSVQSNTLSNLPEFWVLTRRGGGLTLCFITSITKLIRVILPELNLIDRHLSSPKKSGIGRMGRAKAWRGMKRVKVWTVCKQERGRF